MESIMKIISTFQKIKIYWLSRRMKKINGKGKRKEFSQIKHLLKTQNITNIPSLISLKPHLNLPEDSSTL
jgi:hypothetical protein